VSSERIDLTEEQLARISARAVRLYAEMHPRPTQVTQQQAAEMLGVCRRTVRNYIKAGKLRLNGAGYLPIEALDALRSSQ
jgi:predicted DNA-binding protein (UPF0251 family)